MSSVRDHWRLMGLCSLLSFSVNFQYSFSSTYTNSAVFSFKSYINASFERKGEELTEQKYSLLWNVICNVWFIGFFVGIWISRWLTDTYGRKVAFLVGNFINVVGSILSCLSIVVYEPYLLLVSRLVSSTATSISYCALVLYLQEVPPSAKRGTTSFLNGMIFSYIAILGITLGNDQLLGKHLVYYMGFAIIPSVFSFFVLFFLPETPKYLVCADKSKAAERSISFYHGKTADSAATLKLIEADINDANNDHPKYSDIFTQKHLRAAFWLALAALQCTVALWTILLSSTYYLQETGVEHSVAQWSSAVMAVAYAAGTTTGMFTIDRFGRRTLLLWANAFNMASLIFFVLFAEAKVYVDAIKYGCLFMFALFGYTFGAGVGPVARFVQAELVPLRYRSMMTAIAFSVNTISNEVTSFSCRPLFDLIGPYAFLVLYVIPSLICTTYIYFYLPETKGREISEIVQELKDR